MLEVILFITLSVVAALLVSMSLQLRRAYQVFKAPVRISSIGKEVDFPSVSVCVPARNEQHALTDCLDRLVASTYEKLEIIVLDDVSGDDTSALIKSYASEGVRFIKGAALPPGWLGKNHALQQLLNEASGSYILFMDVDTVISPDAIENIVRYAISHKASMVSVLPRREDGWRGSVLFSPLRYFWELIFSRRLSPATASNAWLVRRKILEDRFGGFTTFKNAVQPESKLSAELNASNEYRFIIGSAHFGVSYEKKWRSQLLTSVRLLFPLLNKDIALSIIVAVDLVMLLVPFVVSCSVLWTPMASIHVYAGLLALCSMAVYASYTRMVWQKGWVVGGLLFPYLLFQELILVIISVIQYKRRTVTWKGRSIRPEVQS